MHEMSIATALLRDVLDAAARHGVARVEQVELRVGAMRLVVPEALELAWSVVAEGTPAEASRLVITEVPMKARCRQCGGQFAPAINDFQCPACGQADADIVEGDDIILASVTCRSEEGAADP
jgi:hydrogenase nickel incorporation protein HypA/HybF